MRDFSQSWSVAGMNTDAISRKTTFWIANCRSWDISPEKAAAHCKSQLAGQVATAAWLQLPGFHETQRDSRWVDTALLFNVYRVAARRGAA